MLFVSLSFGLNVWIAPVEGYPLPLSAVALSAGSTVHLTRWHVAYDYQKPDLYTL